jgi:hypothetical protein
MDAAFADGDGVLDSGSVPLVAPAAHADRAASAVATVATALRSLADLNTGRFTGISSQHNGLTMIVECHVVCHVIP